MCLKFLQCSRVCGVGYQIREIFCETGNGEIVNENKCDALDKPVDRRKCFETSCQLSAKLAHKNPNEVVKDIRWTVGDWSDVSH